MHARHPGYEFVWAQKKLVDVGIGATGWYQLLLDHPKGEIEN